MKVRVMDQAGFFFSNFRRKKYHKDGSLLGVIEDRDKRIFVMVGP